MKKRNLSIITVLALIVLLFPLISAGLFDFLKPTGRASDANVDLSVSVTSSPPWIYDVTPAPAITPTVGPGLTYFHVNFSVNDSDGAANLVNSSAQINVSLAGEETRFNTSCAILNYGGDHANFSCLVTMYWYDGNGDWEIGVNVTDQNNNIGSNTTDVVTINILDGIEMYPGSLAFATLTPGIYNETPTNHLYMNNTGNQDYASTAVEVEALDLLGESTPSLALWAGNFSASPQTGGNIECNITASATALQNATSVGIASVVLNKGDYTPNDGTAQEEMYLCLREVGAELSEQVYSTTALGAWTVRVA